MFNEGDITNLVQVTVTPAYRAPPNQTLISLKLEIAVQIERLDMTTKAADDRSLNKCHRYRVFQGKDFLTIRIDLCLTLINNRVGFFCAH